MSGPRFRMTALAAVIIVAAAVLGPIGARPAQALQSIALTRLRISSPYTGRPPECSPLCFQTPLSGNGTISVDVSCILIWCFGTTRIQARDPLEPTKTLTLGGFGVGIVQVCPDPNFGTSVGLTMSTLVTTAAPPGMKVSPTTFSVWAGPGMKAGQFTMSGAEPPAGASFTGGWVVYGQVDPAAITAQAVVLPFWLGLLCF